MRARPLILLALVVSPVALSAQRIPFHIGRRPGGPTQLPPTATPIARELAYKRLNYSVESYPMVSYFDAPGLGVGMASHWTSFGMGSRLDYRVTRIMSATFDATATMLGGPANTMTAELGTRFRPERNDRKIYPFVDARVGYMAMYDFGANYVDNVYGVPTSGPVGYGAAYSQGYGAIGGAGMEYALSRRFSLITSGSVLRGRLTTYNGSAMGSRSTFPVTALRYTLGLRYNPVRFLAAENNPRM